MVLLHHRIQHLNLLLLVLDDLKVLVAGLLQLSVLSLKLADDGVLAAVVAGRTHLLARDLLDQAALLLELLLQRVELRAVALVLFDQPHQLLSLGPLHHFDHVILTLALNGHLLQLRLQPALLVDEGVYVGSLCFHLLTTLSKLQLQLLDSAL